MHLCAWIFCLKTGKTNHENTENGLPLVDRGNSVEGKETEAGHMIIPSFEDLI